MRDNLGNVGRRSVGTTGAGIGARVIVVVWIVTRIVVVVASRSIIYEVDALWRRNSDALAIDVFIPIDHLFTVFGKFMVRKDYLDRHH